MCSHPEHPRLFRLIHHSLRPYTQLEVVPDSKENEKNILIALSQVLKQIQLWTDELVSDSEDGMVLKPACNGKILGFRSDEHQCLAIILGDLIVLLAVENQFVRHLTDVLQGSKLGELICLLCISMERAISNTLSDSSTPSTIGAEVLGSDSSNCIIILNSRLKNSSWLTAAGVVQVLRNILKSLKQEDDDQYLKTYLNSLTSCLSSTCWDLLNIPIDLNGAAERVYKADALHPTNIGQQESVIVFLGNLVQLFCSLVEQSGLIVAACGSQEENFVLCKIISLVPKLLYWCLGKQGGLNNSCISQYFRHKILMIIIRLSFQVSLEHCVLTLWLQLLHKYFQDILWQPLMLSESRWNDCLEGSPFLLSMSDGVHRVLSRHLQRQAVFIFLKCSFSLINMKQGINEQCTCATQNLCLGSDLYRNLECCSRKKGLLELYEWLRVHLPTDMFVDYEMYVEKCITFAFSFLQLYMHEDGILFEVLLQLLTVPRRAVQWVCKEREKFKEVKKDILFHVSNLFNPVHLFHLLLAELHYDHLVLLDYLISKDTGTSCAEYLLRCLRAICDSWHIFVEFPPSMEFLDQSQYKKTRVCWDGLSTQLEPSSAQIRGVVTPVSPEEKCARDYKYGSKNCGTRGQPFEEARDCLLMLKNSMENLQQKNLFPYNPGVLLRRLTRFQELCLKQENY
ncbi:uncharacterized protein LOC131146073 isoform X2 [Malania oleifera]|uniref:uncharacterized protein LOC131146073 isoform X2 n=1 Tax=Malania oleifera TaxID=397392 RepID=UPI0025ADDCE3|nr:uncharacterized protein LOC131146073 isoform X2 [Malania oleifera]XP_057951377.1 uncharacterized protein LOC131146073 isoform X2 [Malania oleifera]